MGHGSLDVKILSWKKTKRISNYVRRRGVVQFINMYKKLKNRKGDPLKWGDEVEYTIVKFDHENKIAQVSLRSPELLDVLNEKERNDPDGVKSLWRPEYAKYMIEGMPGKPYGGLLPHFNTVEANMKRRREEVSKLLLPGEAVFSLTSFPRLGCENFTYPPTKPTPERGLTQSLFYPDEVIYGHPRYIAATRNLRKRRGKKVAINLPVFSDVNTKIPLDDSYLHSKAALLDHVYMDATGFGMGYCCLQVTFQAWNLDEAKILYDQLAPLCPIMLAFTASAPLHRGFITDTDCRWNIISNSMDCRTEEERALKPLKYHKYVINKSRYDSIDSYLSPLGEKYNDISLVYDEDSYKMLRENDVDHLLARHIAHLFVRDSLINYEQSLYQDDENETEHFENIQSTNWQTMRLKPPPPNSNIGWRVEFRPCDAQTTDFENAATVCFVVLLTRVILSYQLNFIIPISKVDENMKTAQIRNACLGQKFWFRKNTTCGATSDEYEPMSMNEIFNGKEGTFPGLIPLINRYLRSMEVDADTHCTIKKYLEFISNRASGKILTTASWIRKFVTGHPDYKQDSRITEKINYDLLNAMRKIQNGEDECSELLGDKPMTKTQDDIPRAFQNLLETNY